jgi:signal transduction histidine kinase
MSTDTSANTGTDASGSANREFLRRLALFEDLSEDEFERVYSRTHEVSIAAGEVLIAEGEKSDWVFIVLDGRLEVTRSIDRQSIVVAQLGVGEVVGEMAMLRHTPRTATVRALTPGRLQRIEKDDFEGIIRDNSAAALSLLQIVMSRLQNTQAILAQQQKMAGLGMLSAGIAHELNNPAAALVRSSEQLHETLADWEQMTRALGGLGLSDEQQETVTSLRLSMVEHLATAPRLDALARSDEEAVFQDWLDDHGVERSWELAPLLVGTGLDTDKLDRLTADLTPARLPGVIWWLGSSCMVDSLLGEMSLSASRISEIVKAVKTYSFLDRSPVQDVDVRDGLENTLVILRQKLTGVNVVRDYDPELPTIEAYGSQLNQVWTNIIDNALFAMKGHGTLTLRTRLVDDRVIVQVCDTGPGIPDEVQTRIFEPFFTTKGAGVGTGLGLHISHNIVVQQHHGQIRVDSQPGSTCFAVMLPIRAPEVPAREG